MRMMCVYMRVCACACAHIRLYIYFKLHIYIYIFGFHPRDFSVTVINQWVSYVALKPLLRASLKSCNCNVTVTHALEPADFLNSCESLTHKRSQDIPIPQTGFQYSVTLYLLYYKHYFCNWLSQPVTKAWSINGGFPQ